MTTDRLIARLVGGDPAAAAALRAHVATRPAYAAGPEDPAVLVAAALVDPDRPADLLARAAARAATPRDRQLVAIAAAYLAGDTDLLDALTRDHLADHPDSILAAWIAAQPGRTPR